MSEGGRTPEQQALLDALPESYTLPDELAEIWDGLDPRKAIIVTKGGVIAIQAAIDALCFGLLAAANFARAAADRDEKAMNEAFSALSERAITAQNNMHRGIALVAAATEMADLARDLKR